MLVALAIKLVSAQSSIVEFDCEVWMKRCPSCERSRFGRCRKCHKALRSAVAERISPVAMKIGCRDVPAGTFKPTAMRFFYTDSVRVFTGRFGMFGMEFGGESGLWHNAVKAMEDW